MTTTALDLSVATGKDLTASAQALGRALADPTKAAGALRRAGIVLTDQQKEQIKTLTESGKSAQAQAMVLDLVNARVKGSAQAFGNTLPGQIERAKRSFEDLAENAIGALAPALSKVLPVLVQGIQALAPVIGQVATIIADLAQQLISSPAFREFAATLRDIAIQGVQVLAGALRTLVPLVLAVVGPIASLVGALMRSRVAMTALVAAFAAFAYVRVAATVTEMVGKFRELAIVTAATSGVTKMGSALSLLATGFSGVSAKSVGLAPGLTAAGAGLSRVSSAANLAKGAAGALGRGLSSALGGPVGITIGVVAGLATVIGGDLLDSFMKSKDPAARYADAMGRVADSTKAAKDSLSGLVDAMLGNASAQDATGVALADRVAKEKELRALEAAGVRSGPQYAAAVKAVGDARRTEAAAIKSAADASDTLKVRQEDLRGSAQTLGTALLGQHGAVMSNVQGLTTFGARTDEAKLRYMEFLGQANKKVMGSAELANFTTKAREMVPVLRAEGTPAAKTLADALDGVVKARSPQELATSLAKVVTLTGGTKADVKKLTGDINGYFAGIGKVSPSMKWKQELIAGLGSVAGEIDSVIRKFLDLLAFGNGKGKGKRSSERGFGIEVPSFSGGTNATAWMRSQRSAVGGAMGGLSSLARQGFLATDPEAQGIASRSKARAKDYQDLQRRTLQKAVTEAEFEDDKKRAALDLQAFEDEILQEGVEDRATKYAEDMDNLGAQFARGEISAETLNTKLGELLGPNAGETYGNLFGVKWRDAFDAVTGPSLALIREGLGAAPGAAPVAGPDAEPEPPEPPANPNTPARWVSEAKKEQKRQDLLKLSPKKRKAAWTAWFRAHGNDASQVRGFATGGIVTGAMGAIVGEAGPEAIVPLTGTRGRDYMAAVMNEIMRSRGTGTTVVVNVAGNEFSAEEFARKIGPELRRQVALTGSW
jgi:hypothetical protein